MSSKLLARGSSNRGALEALNLAEMVLVNLFKVLDPASGIYISLPEA